MNITFIYNRRTYLFMSLKDFAIACKLDRDEAMLVRELIQPFTRLRDSWIRKSML